MTLKIDLYDKKILYYLDLDSRATLSSMSKKVRLPKETIKYRIDRLVKKGIIRSFNAIINASRFGYTYYKVFLQLKKMLPKEEKSLVNYLRSSSNCSNIRSMEGNYYVSFLAMHKNPESLKKYLDELTNNFGKYLLQKSVHSILTSFKLNQKVFHKGNETKTYFSHSVDNDLKLEDLHYDILRLIVNNSRIKLIEMSRILKTKPQVIRYNLKKLENLGIIVTYGITLSFDTLKRTLYQFDLIMKDYNMAFPVIEYFDSTGCALYAYELLGKYDLSVELYVEHETDLHKILDGFREKFHEHYIDYEVHHIVDDYITNWSPFLPRKVSGNGINSDKGASKDK